MGMDTARRLAYMISNPIPFVSDNMTLKRSISLSNFLVRI